MAVGLHLSQIDEVDELLTNDPLALLIGLVPDQPVSETWSGTALSVRLACEGAYDVGVLFSRVEPGDQPVLDGRVDVLLRVRAQSRLWTSSRGE